MVAGEALAVVGSEGRGDGCGGERWEGLGGGALDQVQEVVGENTEAERSGGRGGEGEGCGEGDAAGGGGVGDRVGDGATVEGG